MTRFEDWFTRPRILVVALTLVPFIIAAEIALAWLSPANRWKFPLGHDFVAFWTAARLWWAGGVAAVYDLTQFASLQAQVSVRPGLLLWHYPPSYLALVLPLGLLPFGLAFLAFTAGGIAAFLATARRILPEPGGFGWALLLGAPVMAATLVQGQNGLYAAACLIGGLAAHQGGRPWLAAGLFAALIAKPHLGVMIPVALAATGDWRAMLRTAALVALGAGTATLIVGPEVWPLAWANTALLALALSEPELLAQMPTLWSALRLAGLPAGPALAAQGGLALFALGAVWQVWRRSHDSDLRLAVVLAATLLVSPYAFRYDMVLTQGATMLLARRGLAQGFVPGERLFLGLLWVWPALFPPVALLTGLQSGVLVSLAATLACLARLR